MKYIVAVSGGVDSVVLLDMLVQAGGHEIIVAHFDHGIRECSANDARFVRGLAATYGLIYEEQREELGATASEEVAREKRYSFLRRLAVQYDAAIVTAHHRDDVVETVAINLIRGTGWRGLAVMAASDIKRPLIDMPKEDIYAYALSRGLEYVEDETNRDSKYLRNRVRAALNGQAVDHAKITTLVRAQYTISDSIDSEVRQFAKRTDRYFYIMQPASSALEILHGATEKKLTRPQCELLLLGIRVAWPGNTYQLGGGISARYDRTSFKLISQTNTEN